mgnify:CR=1 FL=1
MKKKRKLAERKVRAPQKRAKAKASEPVVNEDSSDTVSCSESEKPPAKLKKAKKKEPLSKAIPKKNVPMDSVLSDAETDVDIPPESDDSDLDENIDNGKEDSNHPGVEEDPDPEWHFAIIAELPKQHPMDITSAHGPQTRLSPELAEPIDYFFLFVNHILYV